MTFIVHPLVELAKKAVENYVAGGERISPPDDFPKELLEKKSGVFVTIKNGKELRGCVGTYLPTQNNVAEEVICSAISAAAEDLRFDCVATEELRDLSYDVYVLDEPAMAASTRELDPQKYGVIVKDETMRRCGILLPALEGIDTVEEQILIASRKGGIDPRKEKIVIYKFTAEKFSG